MRRLWVGIAMALAVTLAAGGVVVTQDDADGATANSWVNDVASGSCTRSATRITYEEALANGWVCDNNFSGANTAAQPGDLIVVKAGTYSTAVNVTTDGTAGNKITWRGEYTDGACPTTTNTDVNAPDTRPNPNVTVTGFTVNASYVRVECFKGLGTYSSAIFSVGSGETDVDIIQNYCDGDVHANAWQKPYVCVIAGDVGAGLPRANNVLVDNNYGTETRFGFVAVCEDCTFSNNEMNRLLGCVANGSACALAGAGADDNDYARIFGDNITYRGNYWHGTIATDCWAPAPPAYDCHVDGFQSWSFGNAGESATNITIDGNTVMAMHQGILVRDVTSDVNGEYEHDFNWTVTNNVIVGAQGGFPMTLAAAFEHVGNVVIVNNTMAGPEAGQCATTRLDEGASGTFKNNLFVNCGFQPYTVITGATTSGNATNLLYEEGRDYTCFGTDICDVDPLFVDPDVFNFRTQSGSPARNAGTTTDPPTIDRDGTSRPVAGVYDIGAYESG
jgi:hypothetical protein